MDQISEFQWSARHDIVEKNTKQAFYLKPSETVLNCKTIKEIEIDWNAIKLSRHLSKLLSHSVIIMVFIGVCLCAFFLYICFLSENYIKGNSKWLPFMLQYSSRVCVYQWKIGNKDISEFVCLCVCLTGLDIIFFSIDT